MASSPPISGDELEIQWMLSLFFVFRQGFFPEQGAADSMPEIEARSNFGTRSTRDGGGCHL